MSANTYIAGIDIGTTGAKTTIMTPAGKPLASGYREYGCDYIKPGWVEQDLGQLLQASFEASREALAQGGIDAARIAAISFSTQRTCSIFVDASGELIRPMISWQDNRPIQEVEEIRKEMGDKAFHTITGLPLNTTWNLPKIMWLRRHEPDNFKKTAKICQLQTYFLKAYGAQEYLTDKSSVSLYGLWDLRRQQWSSKILEQFEIDRDLLPRVAPSGTAAGQVSSTAAAQSGFRQGTPIYVGAGDQNSASVGAGVISPGKASISLGTGGLVAAFAAKYPEHLDTSNNILNHAIEGYYQLEGYQAGAAGVLRWFRDEVARLEKSAAESAGRDVYPLLTEMAAGVPAGSDGLLFLPYLASACAPRWNPNARGTLLGLTFAHERPHLIRAFMEGIILEVKDILQSMHAAGVDMQEIRILGGPTKSALWNQIQADMYNRPVETLAMTDAAVLGAGIFAGVGAGIHPTIAAAAQSMVATEKTYQPKAENVAVYEKMYRLYTSTYENLSATGIYEEIATLQSGGAGE